MVVFLCRPLFRFDSHCFSSVGLKQWCRTRNAPFWKGTSIKNFKTVSNGGCRSAIIQVKTDSVSGKIYLSIPTLRFLEAGLSF